MNKRQLTPQEKHDEANRLLASLPDFYNPKGRWLRVRQRAILLSREAANAGHVESMYLFSKLVRVRYSHAPGRKIELGAAIFFLKKAAESGNPDALEDLSRYYSEGRPDYGIARDPLEAEGIAEILKPKLNNEISGELFDEIMDAYESTSWLSCCCFFSPHRSRAIRELRQLAGQDVVTKDQIESALSKDSMRRFNLFSQIDKSDFDTTSTDDIISKLKSAFVNPPSL